MESPVTEQRDFPWTTHATSRQDNPDAMFADTAGHGRVWRLVWLGCGLVLAAQALWLFYFRRWLEFHSPLDDRYAQMQCLVQSWCETGLLTVNHYGVLSAMVACVFFTLATWRLPLFAAIEERVAPFFAGPDHILSLSKNRTALTLFVLLAVQAIGYQAYLLVIRQEQIEFWLWLVGLGAVFAAALVWDLNEAHVLARTLGGCAALTGIGMLLLGLATILSGRWDMAWLVLMGATLLVYGSGRFRSNRHATATVATLDPGTPQASAPRSSDDVQTAHPEIIGELDIYLMAAIAIGALLLALIRAWSGRFAWVGDEWGFFEFGRALLENPDLLRHPFRTHDSNGYHTVFSSALQAGVMYITHVNVFGWRVSSVLPVVYATPAVYLIGHWLGGRRTAVLSAVAYGAAHMLLTFSMIPYNNTQALPVVAGGLALLIVAGGRASALRYGLAGAVMGSGFLLFGLARLVAVPALILFVWIGPWTRRAWGFRFGWLALGGLAAAAPKLFDLKQWQDLLKATPVESEVSAQMSVITQMARNTLTGFLVFLTEAGGQTTHFVAGPHTDLVTALLILVGLAAMVAAIPKQRAQMWLAASLAFLVIVSAIQQYGTVAMTRMFVLGPFYALWAGVGGTALMRCILPGRNRTQWFGIAGLVVTVILLNQVHIEQISLPNSRDSWKFFNVMTQYVQTASRADSGRQSTVEEKAPHKTVVVVDHTATLPINWIQDAYELAPDALVAVYADKQGQVEDVCGLALRGASVLVMANLPSIEDIRTAMATCHPSYRETSVNYPDNGPLLYRYVP